MLCHCCSNKYVNIDEASLKLSGDDDDVTRFVSLQERRWLPPKDDGGGGIGLEALPADEGGGGTTFLAPDNG